MRECLMPMHALTAVQVASAELKAVHVHGDPTRSCSSPLNLLRAQSWRQHHPARARQPITTGYSPTSFHTISWYCECAICSPSNYILRILQGIVS